MLGRIAGAVRFKEPLSFHTAMHIGGPAAFFIEPRDLDDVRYALTFADREGLPVTAIGGGTHVLMADHGFDGVVLKLQGTFARTRFYGAQAVVGAGVNLGAFIREAASRGLGGLEAFAGIPGTVGGALATNVTVPDGALIDRCDRLDVVYPDGSLGEVRSTAAMSSGGCRLPAGSLILGCHIELVHRPSARIQDEIHETLRLKKASEPLALASLGYVWKNPMGGETAAQLIARVGLRGKRLNDTVEVSSKCANFIVNRGGASAADVLALMRLTRARVAAQTGITLEAEIRTAGPDVLRWEPRSLELAPA
jgi:UDP-N-acetylmuramate dehydrogenase